MIALLGTLLGLGFTAGLNLYATVFATGLALRLGWLTPPPDLDSLNVLSNPLVLAVAGVLYAIEFLADKIPIVEHVWDAVHTFIRPLGATWLAWHAVQGAHLSEPIDIVVALLTGGVALSSHLGKAGARVAATSSGGHLFGLNILLSLIEDAVSLIVAPLALVHPLVVLAIVIVLLAGLAALATRAVSIRSRRSRT